MKKRALLQIIIAGIVLILIELLYGTSKSQMEWVPTLITEAIATFIIALGVYRLGALKPFLKPFGVFIALFSIVKLFLELREIYL